MPFRGSHGFNPSKAMARKSKLPASLEAGRFYSRNLGLDIDEVSLKLGRITLTFNEADGRWTDDISRSPKKLSREAQCLRAKIEAMEREKNLLRVKRVILMDTITCKKLELRVVKTELKGLLEILWAAPLRFANDSYCY